MKLITTTLLSTLLAAGANAQAVYRCGSAYSQTPCPQARIVEVGDPRSAAQQADARRVADDERRLAADMRRDRLAEQGASRPAGAASLSGPVPTKPASAVEPHHHKKKRASVKPTGSTDFVAIDPGSRKRRGRV